MKRFRIDVDERVETTYSFVIEVEEENHILEIVYNLEFPEGAKCETASDAELILRNDPRVKRILRTHKGSSCSKLDDISYCEVEEN